MELGVQWVELGDWVELGTVGGVKGAVGGGTD